jgi:hypothetical protein
MRGTGEIDERSKIRIDRNQNAALPCGNPQQCSVAWVGTLLARIPYIVTLFAQPVCQPQPGAAVNEKSHAGATFTASSRSFATTA